MNKKILIVALVILVFVVLFLSLQESQFAARQSLPNNTMYLADVRVETVCTDKVDNDGDGLVDSQDGECWLRDGAVFVEDQEPVRTFNELSSMAQKLKDIGIKTVETLPVWEHASENNHWARWAVRNYSNMDPERGTESELQDFITSAHDAGLKIVPMIQITGTFANGPACTGRIIPDEPVYSDQEKIGGYYYQYQMANPTKNILLKNKDGDFVCLAPGYGFAVNQDSPDTITLTKDIYASQILSRGFDGIRLDASAINHCIKGEEVFMDGKEYACIDPATEKHSPLPLYRELSVIKIPSQVFIAEVPYSHFAFSDYNVKYPYYTTNPDIDEVAEASEGYEFKSLLSHLAANDKTSAELVSWVNNQPILYDRQRFRMIRNWNVLSPAAMTFVTKDAKYYPAVALAVTIPGIPKVSDYELFGNEEWENKLKIEVTNTPEDRTSYWKKILNIRNSNNALKYGNIKNAWESGDSIYAYSRTYENETAIVVINFNGKATTSVLNLPFKSGIALKDELSGETFKIADADNFKVTVSAYSSRILTVNG